MPNNGTTYYYHICCFFMLLISSSILYQQTTADINEISTSASSSSNALIIQEQQQISSNENDEDYMPQKENVLEKSYHGLIRENETLVEITPLIKVDEEKICSLRILKKPYHEMPFEIEMYNNLGILKAHHALNCEKRKNYHFELVAVFCDGLLSAPANVHITVVDINEYAPVFLQNEYHTEIDEGYLYKDIIRIEAIDKDCTPLYGDVCKYEILNNKQKLFNIDNDGSIRNLKPLSSKLAHNHLLNIVAYDCAMKISKPITVNIKVRSLCVPQIKGIPEHINYIHHDSKGVALFANADLELCDMQQQQCNAQNLNIHTSIVLETNHIALGCDRETLNCTYNNNNNNNNNNNIEKKQIMINLLEKNREWTKNLKSNNNNNDDVNEPIIYHFDGNTGITIPENILTQHDFASQSFSIVTVFRHESIQQQQTIDDNNDIKHIKEHILCSADDHKMNRHHMALFVRNCRLILLLRKNFNDGDLNIFSPAEWRWKIPHVCDNQWHHYVINVNNNNNNNNNNNGNIKIDLYIDGILFNRENFKNNNDYNNDDHHNNPEIIDDWPLHAAQGIKTKLTVGACYQSSLNKLKHTFRGDISEIKINLNNILNDNNIKCLTKCTENLLINNYNDIINNLPIATQIQMNTKLNEIYIETNAKNNLIKLLKNIHYINNKLKPTNGQRHIEIRTTIMCNNSTYNATNGTDSITIRLPIVKTHVNIMKAITTTTLSLPMLHMLMPHAVREIESVEQRQQEQQEINVNDDDGVEEEDDNDENITLIKTKHKILIMGMSNKLVSYAEIKKGVRIFKDVNLTTTTIIKTKEQQQEEEDEEAEEMKNNYLTGCSVVVFPSLNPDHEDINIYNEENNNDDTVNDDNNDDDDHLNIKTNINKEGVKMLGYDSINNYMKILHKLIYSNKKPAYYLNRVFKLICHNKNKIKLIKKQQQHTGEYTLTLTVLHPKQQQQQFSSSSLSAYGMSTISPMLQAKTAAAREDAVFSHVMLNSHAAEETQAKLHEIIHKTESTHSTMLIALACIFIAIILCGMYVARLRNHNKIMRHQPCPKQIVDDSLAWDDSALTITINPMQSDAISDDASCTDSDNSDTDDDDEEVLKARFSNVNQLEWDNSNIFTSAIN